MDFWTLYGTAAPTPDPQNPPPACAGQVWVLNGWDSTLGVYMDNGARVPVCWGVPQTEWPPFGAFLVAGPHSPWRAE